MHREVCGNNVIKAIPYLLVTGMPQRQHCQPLKCKISKWDPIFPEHFIIFSTFLKSFPMIPNTQWFDPPDDFLQIISIFPQIASFCHFYIPIILVQIRDYLREIRTFSNAAPHIHGIQSFHVVLANYFSEISA